MNKIALTVSGSCRRCWAECFEELPGWLCPECLTVARPCVPSFAGGLSYQFDDGWVLCLDSAGVRRGYELVPFQVGEDEPPARRGNPFTY
jgi:hypothetical protein